MEEKTSSSGPLQQPTQEDAECQEIRNVLARELKFSAMSNEELEPGYKQLLLDIKVPEVKKELRYALNNIERWYEAKDFKISVMMDELDEANTQSERIRLSHLETIENYIQIFRDQVNDLKTKYEKDLYRLATDMNISLNVLKDRDDFYNEYMNMMIFGLESEGKQGLKSIRSEYISKINSETLWYDQQLNFMINSGVLKTFENLWKGYNEVFNEFFDYTAERSVVYQKLKKHDTQLIDLMDRQVRQIVEFKDTIKRLKYADVLNRKDLYATEKDLLDQRNSFRRSFRLLKSRLNYNAKNDQEKLIELTNRCEDIKQYLNNIKGKGERILRYMSLCRKYETEKEKVLAYPNEYTAEEFGPAKLLKSTFILPCKIRHQIVPFLQKVGTVDSTRQELYNEATYLKKENEHLQNLIKKYCDKAACRCMFPTVLKIPKPPSPKKKTSRKTTTNRKSVQFNT